MAEINFICENGNRNCGNIKLYALSTCAFCKKALKYLRDNSISFMYVFVDEMEQNDKQKLKAELKEKYKKDVGFPFMIINEDKVIVGFTEDEYKKLFPAG